MHQKLTTFIFVFFMFLFAFRLPAFADTAFTVSNMDFNSTTGAFSFDYDANGVTLNHQVTLRLPYDAAVFNYDANVGDFSCTSSHCSGTYTGNKSNFSCSGSDYRIMSTTNVNGNEIQYTSNALAASDFSNECSNPTPTPTPPPFINVTGFEYLPCSPDCRTLRISYDNFPAPDMGLINVDASGNFISGAYGSTAFTDTYVDFTIPDNNRPWDQYMQLASSNGGLSRILNILEVPTPTPTPAPFAVSNVTFDQSTLHYSFNYSGYTGGNITGESTEIHADDDSWGYNHEPANCTGGSSGSGTCTGTFNAPHGTYSCSAGTINVGIYGYNVGSFVVSGLANPDPACVVPTPTPTPPPFINVTGFEYLPCTPDCRTLVIHYDNFQAPDMGLINVDASGNFISGAYGSTSFTDTEVVFDIPNNNQPWDQYMQLASSNGGLSAILNLLDTPTPTPTPTPVNNFAVSNVTFNHTTGQYSFDYSGYTGGDITGESTAIHADDESWGYNHQPATCTGGALGSGTCSGTFNHSQGTYSCSNTMYVGIYGYHAGQYAVHNLTNPDPGCVAPTPTPTPLPNQAPSVSFNVGSTDINEGDVFSATGSFTDPDSTSWTATVNYGDGSGVQALQLSGQTFSLSHVYVDNGTYTITVSVTDNGNLTGTSTGTGGGVVVNNPAPVIPPITPPTNVGQNSPAVLSITIVDYGNQSHTATINWGDGSGNQSVPVSGNDFSSDHNYQNPGTYTVIVTVIDSQGATTTQTLTITVVNVPPHVGTISVPSSVQVNNSAALSVNFTDQGVVDTHTATINWGDGNTTNGTVSEASGSGSVNGNHTYTSAGTYTITVTVTDDDNGSGNSTSSITVNPAPTPTPTPTPTNTPTPTPTLVQLSVLSPVGIWIGLKNSDDVGTKFDLKVEAYKGSTLVASGELDTFAGGSSGFNNAHLATIPFDSFTPVTFPSGSVLSLKVYVRNACVGSGHNSGFARLWYNDSAANSRFGTTIGGNSVTRYLRDNFLLATSAGSQQKTIDVQSGAKCSVFKTFGSWTVTP